MSQEKLHTAKHNLKKDLSWFASRWATVTVCTKLAKVMMINLTEAVTNYEVVFQDLFEELCPVAIHQALSAYDGRRQELVNIEVTKLKDATNLMNQLLSSMNLPAAIEATKGMYDTCMCKLSCQHEDDDKI